MFCFIVVFNLTNGIDVRQTEERIAEYKKENEDFIKKNRKNKVFVFRFCFFNIFAM